MNDQFDIEAIKELINGNGCWACGKVFDMSNPCKHVQGMMLCKKCAQRIEKCPKPYVELIKMILENLPSDRNYICEKANGEGLYCVQIIRGLSCRIPQVCSCCLGPAEKTETITFMEPCFSGTRKFFIDAPICKECLKHRKGLFTAAKRLGPPHTSKDNSFTFFKAELIDVEEKKFGDIKYHTDSWVFLFTNYEYAVLFKEANKLKAGAVRLIGETVQ